MSDKSKQETAIHQNAQLQVTETIKNEKAKKKKNEKATCAAEEDVRTPIPVDSHYQRRNNRKIANGS